MKKFLGNNPKTNYLPLIVTSAVFSFPALTGGLIWLYFLTPLPVLYYLLSLDSEQGVGVILKAALISGIVATFLQVLPVQFFSFTLVPVGFIIAQGIRNKQAPYATALKAVIYLTATWILTGLAIGSAYHTNLYSEIILNIDKGLAAAFENYNATAQLPPATLLEVEAAFTELRLLVPRVLPGVMLMTVICTVWINLVSGDWLLKKKNPGISSWTKFRTWRLPEQLVWGIILSGFLLFLPNVSLNNVGINGLLVLGLIYFFQGLAVITFLLAKWSVPRPVKLFLYTLLIVQAYGMIILAGLGIADVWLNFRAPKPDKDEQTKN